MALNADPRSAPDGAPDRPDGDEGTDGRQLRRKRNREAVVEALLDLYRDGNLRPSTEEIAARSGLSPRSLFRYFEDVDGLTRSAIMVQEARAMPLVTVDTAPDEPTDRKIAALVEQRFRLFDSVGNVAAVVRLRAPFNPVLSAELTRNRRFLRKQVSSLFAPELEAMGEPMSDAVLAAADVLTSYESYQLLTEDRSMTSPQASAHVIVALTALFDSRS